MPSAIELMQEHLDALYLRDADGRLVAVNQWDGGIPPRFYLGRTAEGHVWAARHDLPAATVETLKALVLDEPVLPTPSPVPLGTHEFRAALDQTEPVRQQWAGPAYWLADSPPPTAGGTVEITADNAHVLAPLLPDWLPDAGNRHPFVASLDDQGHAVAVCASARQTPRACEAGVETHPAFRRRGYAARAVRHWARLVIESGATPLYSTSWNNRASSRLAITLGFADYGVDFHLT